MTYPEFFGIIAGVCFFLGFISYLTELPHEDSPIPMDEDGENVYD